MTDPRAELVLRGPLPVLPSRLTAPPEIADHARQPNPAELLVDGERVETLAGDLAPRRGRQQRRRPRELFVEASPRRSLRQAAGGRHRSEGLGEVLASEPATKQLLADSPLFEIVELERVTRVHDAFVANSQAEPLLQESATRILEEPDELFDRDESRGVGIR